MADAESLHARGNVLYQEGRFEEARVLYADAIAALLKTSVNVHSDETRVRVAALYSNRAQTFVQERNFALALHEAVRALEYDPANEKAQLRRLIALQNLERFETAFRLVERVLADPTVRTQQPGLFEYAINARRSLRKNIQQDSMVAKRESHAVGRMVHANQKLRINFGCLIPSHVVVGEFFDVSVNIGNEFGLFRRQLLPDGEGITLQCSLRNNAGDALKLVFREASSGTLTNVASTLDAVKRTTPVHGLVTLNDRGKASFQLAIVPTNEDETHACTPRSNLAIAFFVHDDAATKWNLLPIVSLPFTLTATTNDNATIHNHDHDHDHDQRSASLGIHCCRPVWLPTLDRELLLAESPGNLGIGGKLWDSCLVLTRYLARYQHELCDKTVVELGSGLGLVGLFCALLGARHVTLTDMDDVVPLLAYNIHLNFPAAANDASLVAVPHFWGTPVENLPVPAPDVLVLSDVVYDPEGYAPLVASLHLLAPTPHTTIFMAHRSRNPMEHQFFELLAETFVYELVDWAREEHAATSASSAAAVEEEVEVEASAMGKDERVLQDVKIFRISRRV